MNCLVRYTINHPDDLSASACKLTVYGPQGEDERLGELVEMELDPTDGTHVSDVFAVPCLVDEFERPRGTYYAVLSVIEDEATAKELNRDWQPKPGLQDVSSNLQRIVDLDVDTDRDNLVEVDEDEPGGATSHGAG